MRLQGTLTVVEDMLEVRLAAETRAYIDSLEVCSFCDRVSPCRPLTKKYGWECLDRESCLMTCSQNIFLNDRHEQFMSRMAETCALIVE